jgi:hypothetical protein
VGKYLAILAALEAKSSSDKSDKSPPFGRFGRTFSALEARCPDHVSPMRWEQAVEDGRRFLATWGSQAEALGWTPADLFGLHKPPERPHPSYNRLSRYDCTGLCWLLQGPSGRGADRGHRRDPELDRRHHHLPQAQQAGARPSGRFPR